MANLKKKLSSALKIIGAGTVLYYGGGKLINEYDEGMRLTPSDTLKMVQKTAGIKVTPTYKMLNGHQRTLHAAQQGIQMPDLNYHGAQNQQMGQEQNIQQIPNVSTIERAQGMLDSTADKTHAAARAVHSWSATARDGFEIAEAFGMDVKETRTDFGNKSDKVSTVFNRLTDALHRMSGK